MKTSHFIKLLCLILFVIFALQVTDVTCYGEDLSFETPAQSGHQLKAGDSDNNDAAKFSSGILEHCQCPCHLSFSPSPAASSIPCLLTDARPIIVNSFSIQKTSTDIFQPPKSIL
ncbi:MAG: hypothetical protein AAB356_06495 [Deltaproteobacteria bacterium]